MKIGSYEIHQAADVFPMMAGPEWHGFVENVRAHGLIEPILVNVEGVVIDGRNRLKACIELGIEPRFLTCRDIDGQRSIDLIVSLNIQRRHMTQGQRAAIAVELVPLYEAAAKERMLAGTADPSADRRKAATDAAAAMGASPRSVEKAIRVKKADAALLARVKSGTISLDAAHTKITPRAKPDPDSISTMLINLESTLTLVGEAVCRARDITDAERVDLYRIMNLLERNDVLISQIRVVLAAEVVEGPF